MAIYDVNKLTNEARKLAIEYREATGKILPITAEIAINDAIHIIGMTASQKGEVGHDAVWENDGQTFKIQIKGRTILQENKSGHRLGQLKLEQEWDGIMLVVMNDLFAPQEIYFCHREEIEEALSDSEPNKRGSMSLAKFKIIAELIWTQEDGLIDGVWSNQE